MFGASGAYPVFGYGRWWTILSAGWLHGGALHILFNMMWVRQIGPAVADIYGAGRMVIIYTCRRHRISPQFASWARTLPDSVLRRGRPDDRRVRARFSACSARWCTTDGAAAAAW